jgi:hypothetical protein
MQVILSIYHEAASIATLCLTRTCSTTALQLLRFNYCAWRKSFTCAGMLGHVQLLRLAKVIYLCWHAPDIINELLPLLQGLDLPILRIWHPVITYPIFFTSVEPRL